MAANDAYLELRDVVLPVVGLSNAGVVANRQTTQFLVLHGLTSIDDFGRLEPHQAKDLVKSMNSRHPAASLGIIVQNNLTGLIWHVKDQRRRGLQLDPNDIDGDDLLNGHLAYEAYVQNRDKGENIKALEKWNDKIDFDDWDRKVTETLSLVYGRNYCPLAYVIRPDKPAGWDPVNDATTDYERLMYQLSLNGPAYDRDNEAVFSYIQLAVLQTLAENWIFDAVPGRDGRAAMRALRDHYQGEAELDVRATKAQQILDTMSYTSEKNILKLIKPLFLDELWTEFESIKTNKAKLNEFHLRLSKMKFLDPACGCGNFLVITYRELRLLELAILQQQYGSNRVVIELKDVALLDVDIMAGIEYEEFPARIAEVAMWLIDHQMNMLVSSEFGQYFVRLPLKKSAKIVHADALETDWENVVSKNDLSYVIGNPPFIGCKHGASLRRALEWFPHAC